MKKIFLYISALLAGAACTAQETLLSPDGRLRLEFSLADGGRPTYTLDYKERPVILPSGMGLELRGEAPKPEFGAEIRKGRTGAPGIALRRVHPRAGGPAASPTRHGVPYGASRPRSATAITKWPSRCIRPRQAAT